MKNLFSFNLNNEDEELFSPVLKKCTLREIDKEFSKKQDETAKKMDELEKKWTLPGWLAVVRVVAILLGAMLFVTVINTLSERGKEAFSSPATVIFLVVGILLVGFGAACFVIEGTKKKKVENSDEYKNLISYAEGLLKSSEEELKIPTDRICVDVFYYPYEEKDGKEKKVALFKYLNHQLFLFKENDCLCLADASVVFGIKLEYIKKIVKIPGSVAFAGWNKEESRGSEKYKPYRIHEDKLGILYTKNTVSIQLDIDGEEYEIVIPPYELEHFEAITDLRAVGMGAE